MNRLFRLLLLDRITTLGVFFVIAPLGMTVAQAQITPPRNFPAARDQYATLQEQLVNQLRATRHDQQAYIDYVLEQVRLEILDTSLVIAIERYAMRRNRQYPFPFFERALRYEAAKRGVVLPTVQHFASSRMRPGTTTTPQVR